MLAIILNIDNEEERTTAEQIWEKYQAYIKIVASKILRNPSDVDDAVMDTIRCVVQSIHKFVGLSDLDIVCLVTVYTQHASYKIYNQNKAKNAFVNNTEDYDIEDATTNIESIIVKKSEYAEAAKHLSEIPEIYSHTFFLRYYYGWSIRDIMTYFDLTEATVKKRLYRAKQLLKERMENPYE